MSGRLCWNVWKWEEKSFLKLAKFNHFSNIFFFSFFLLLLLLLCVLPSSFGLSLYVVRRYTQFSSRRLRRRPSALIFNILSHTLDVLCTLLTIHMRKSRRSSRQNATQSELCIWQNKSEQRLQTVLEKITTSSIKHRDNWFTNYSKTFNKSISKQRDQPNHSIRRS